MKKILTLLLLLPTLALAVPRTIELNENNTINFNQAFDASFVAYKQLEAINTCFENIGKDIYITLYTPGGSISAGQLFFDTLNALPCTFHTITIFSASMGYQTVQNLGKRFILPSGILMSHRASISGLSGELGGELDSIMDLLKKNVKEMETVAANRVGITLEEYRSAISDELWMTGPQAVKMNHADEVVLVKCDNSLMGSRIVDVQTFLGTLEVEFSDCPLITAPLSVRAPSRRSKRVFLKKRSNITKQINTTL